MNSFTYFTLQTNITVIKTLHHCAPQAPAEFYHNFGIEIAFRVTVSLIHRRQKKFSVLGPV